MTLSTVHLSTCEWHEESEKQPMTNAGSQGMFRRRLHGPSGRTVTRGFELRER